MIVPRYYEDLSVLHENTMPARAYYIPASKRMDNLVEHRDESDRMQLLNGNWKFQYFNSIYDVQESFFEKNYDTEEFDEIQVPSVWQMAGYDMHQYTNIRYPFPFDPPYVPQDIPCGAYAHTPIARMRGNLYELDLVLRNNITTDECPLGLFHPHAEYHHIKKENIGLIEVMGLAVLPARLKKEMAELEQAILNHENLRQNETMAAHADWAEEWIPKYQITNSNIHSIVQKEIGIVFTKVLEDAGVYKRTEEGKAAFKRFIDNL